MGTYSITQLYNKIGDLATQKESLRQALLAQGADVSTNVLLDDYPNIISSLCGHPDIRLDYIENGEYNSSKRNDVYFNTDFIPDTSTAIELKYTIPSSTDTGLGWIIGSNNTSYTNRKYGISLLVSNTSTTSGSITTTASYNQNAKYGFAYDLSINVPHTLFCYYDGTRYYTNIDSSTQYRSATITYNSVDVPMSIYAVNESGTYNQKCKGNVKIYYIKIWKNKVLQRDYIPVLHWYNDSYVPCLYDKVNDNYIYNLGTDTLTYKLK